MARQFRVVETVSYLWEPDPDELARLDAADEPDQAGVLEQLWCHQSDPDRCCEGVDQRDITEQ